MLRGILLAVVFLFTPPAFAGEPADLVKRFYDRELNLFDEPVVATYTAGSLQAFLDELFVFSKEHPDYPCVDFDPIISAQDYDDEELQRTLKLDEEADGGSAIVTATFDIFSETRSVIWQLQEFDGTWKVTDMASPDGEWRFSDMVCEAE